MPKAFYLAVLLLIFFVLLTAIGLLLPSHVLVSRAIDIPSENTKVAPLINNISGWQTWMEGARPDNPKGLKGQLGDCSIVLDSSNPLRSVWTGIHSKEKQCSEFRLFGHGGITTVQWQFSQDIGWLPWERLSSMVNDKVIGTTMEQNLLKLKQAVMATSN